MQLENRIASQWRLLDVTSAEDVVAHHRGRGVLAMVLLPGCSANEIQAFPGSFG